MKFKKSVLEKMVEFDYAENVIKIQDEIVDGGESHDLYCIVFKEELSKKFYECMPCIDRNLRYNNMFEDDEQEIECEEVFPEIEVVEKTVYRTKAEQRGDND